MAVFAGPEIVNTGLVLHLDAANPRSYPGSGTVWTDLSGNGNNGTLVNGVGYNSANNGSMIFDGANDYVSTNFNPNLDNRLYTYEAWFKDNSPGGFTDNTTIISSYGFTATTPHSQFHIFNDGTIRILERNSAGTLSFVKGSTNICDGSWKQLVATASSTELRLYINGVLIGSAVRPGGVITSGQNFILGSGHLDRYQSCSFSNFKIYMDKALSQQEVRQNFEATRSRYGI